MESCIQTSSCSRTISESDGNQVAISIDKSEESHPCDVSQKPLDPSIRPSDINSSSCHENNGRKQTFDTDNASMTIDFLRARLLSERSISKSAKERAKHLAKKVIELEGMLETELNRRKLSQAAVEKALVELQSAGLQEQFAHMQCITKQAENENERQKAKDDLASPIKASNEDSRIARATSSFQQKTGLTKSGDDPNIEKICESQPVDLQKESASVVGSAIDEVLADDIPEDTNTPDPAVSPSPRSNRASHLSPVGKIERSCHSFTNKSMDCTKTRTIFKLEASSNHSKDTSDIKPDFPKFLEMDEKNPGFEEHDLFGHGTGKVAGSCNSGEDSFFQECVSTNAIEFTDEKDLKLGLDLNDTLGNGRLEGQTCQSQPCNLMKEVGVSSKPDSRPHDLDIGIADGFSLSGLEDAEKRDNVDSNSTSQPDSEFCSDNNCFEEASPIPNEVNSESLSMFKILLPEGGSSGSGTDGEACNQSPLEDPLRELVSLETKSKDHVSTKAGISEQTSSSQNIPSFPNNIGIDSDKQICAGGIRVNPSTGTVEESSGGNLSIQQCSQCISKIQLQANNVRNSSRSSSLYQESCLKQGEEAKLKRSLRKSRSSCSNFTAEELEEVNWDASDAYYGKGFIQSRSADGPCSKKSIPKPVCHASNGSCYQEADHFNCGHIKDDVRQKQSNTINCSCGKIVDDNFYPKTARITPDCQRKIHVFRNNIHLNVTNDGALESESSSPERSQSESPPKTLMKMKTEQHGCWASPHHSNTGISKSKAGLQRPCQDQLACACVVVNDGKKFRQAEDRKNRQHSLIHNKPSKATRSDLCTSHVHGCSEVPECRSFGKSLQQCSFHDIGNIASSPDRFLNTAVLEPGTNKCKTSKYLENGFLSGNIDRGHPDHSYRRSCNWNQTENDLESRTNVNRNCFSVSTPEVRPYDAYIPEPRQNIDTACLERHRHLSQFRFTAETVDNNSEIKSWAAFRDAGPSQALVPASVYMGQHQELKSLTGNENLHTVLAALRLAKEHVKSTSDQRQFSSSYADDLHYGNSYTYGTRNYIHRSFGYSSERGYLDFLSTREAHALQEREYQYMNRNAYDYRYNFTKDRINSVDALLGYPWYH